MAHKPTPAAKPSDADRLEEVWTILTNPKRSIRSIQMLAVEYGFDDLAAFNELFKERYGTTAAALRKFAKKPGRRK